MYVCMYTDLFLLFGKKLGWGGGGTGPPLGPPIFSGPPQNKTRRCELDNNGVYHTTNARTYASYLLCSTTRSTFV